MYTSVPSLAQPLEAQIKKISKQFPSELLDSEVLGVLLIGSCSRGEATYRSDIDLLVVLAGGALTYSRVQGLRDRIESAMGQDTLNRPLRCDFSFVLRDVFQTSEPAMQEALKHAKVLVDSTNQLESKLHE